MARSYFCHEMYPQCPLSIVFFVYAFSDCKEKCSRFKSSGQVGALQVVIRGRPLMIWGGGGKIENEFIFSAGMSFEIIFFLEKGFRNSFPRFPPAQSPDH